MRDLPGEKIIERSMILLGISEAFHLLALFGGFSISFCIKAALPVWAAALVLFFVYDFKKSRKKEKADSTPEFLEVFRQCPGYVAAFFLLVVFQIVFFLFMHVPVLTGDITGETVQTFLTEDAVYTVNPMTGMPFTSGMPFRIKILGLPFCYTVLCRLFSCPAPYMVYRIIPMLTLIGTYIVYGLWARFLFPKNYKNQMTFLLIVALIFQFGCYGTSTDSSYLLFGGWQGEAVRACILLPYALLCLLKKRYRGVVACILTEACIVWTFYGAGYVLLMTAIVAVIRFVDRRYRRKLMKRFKKEGQGV